MEPWISKALDGLYGTGEDARLVVSAPELADALGVGTAAVREVAESIPCDRIGPYIAIGYDDAEMIATELIGDDERDDDDDAAEEEEDDVS